MPATAPLLNVIEEAGAAVLILTDGLTRDDLLRSRLTQAEVQRHLQMLADVLAGAAPALRQPLPEVDWDGWALLGQAVATPGAARDEALWFAVQSLVPATLGWLRVARQAQPVLFTQWD